MNKRLPTIILLAYFLVPTTLWAANAQTSDQSKAAPQYTIEIASPLNGETFQNSTDTITVSVTITPALEEEDNVAIVVDGAQSAPAHSTSVSIPRLERGSHTLQAKVIQPKGSGASSALITVYQQRTSKLLPN